MKDDGTGLIVFMLIVIVCALVFVWGFTSGGDNTAYNYCIAAGYDDGQYIDADTGIVCEYHEEISGDKEKEGG